jgi:hypothetical protein
LTVTKFLALFIILKKINNIFKENIRKMKKNRKRKKEKKRVLWFFCNPSIKVALKPEVVGFARVTRGCNLMYPNVFFVTF